MYHYHILSVESSLRLKKIKSTPILLYPLQIAQVNVLTVNHLKLWITNANRAIVKIYRRYPMARKFWTMPHKRREKNLTPLWIKLFFIKANVKLIIAEKNRMVLLACRECMAGPAFLHMRLQRSRKFRVGHSPRHLKMARKSRLRKRAKLISRFVAIQEFLLATELASPSFKYVFHQH